MLKTEDVLVLAGLDNRAQSQAPEPTNLHIITGEVVGDSESGKTLIQMEGLVFGEDDSQVIEVDTLGGLEEGDEASILLIGQNGQGMTPLAIGSPGSVDRAVARIAAIEADYVKTDVLEANYAQIDAANILSAEIRTAWVDTILVESGLVAKEGTIYTLDALEVNAVNIKAGTIDVDRLVVNVDGQKYLVHIDTTSTTPVTSYEKLDGNIIEDRTITADKLVVGAITANEIAANAVTADKIAGNSLQLGHLDETVLDSILNSNLSGDIDEINEELTSVSGDLSALRNELEAEINERKAWLYFDADGGTGLHIGEYGGPFHTAIDSDSLDFVYTDPDTNESEVVATASVYGFDSSHMTSDDITIGEAYQWTMIGTTFALVYVGG